jgi:RND family efflux transporter MFP subunit
MSVRRSLVVLFFLIVGLPIVIFGRSNLPSTQGDQLILSNLQLYEIRQGTVSQTVTALGNIEANEVVALSFLVPGRVAEVLIQANEYVLPGDELIRLENETQQLQYQQALVTLDQALLEYDDLLTVDETTVQLAEASVDAAFGAYLSAANAVSEGDVRAAEIAYEQALARAEELRLDRDRIGGQFGADSNAYTAADARYGEATFQAEIARLQAEELRTASAPQAYAAYARYLEAQAQLEQTLAGPTQAELDAAETNITQAENQLERAETTFARTILQTPIEGVVSALNVEPGALIAPAATVVEVTDISPLGLTVQVDEIDVGLVDVGLAVRVELDGLPDVQFPATVSSVAPLGTPSGGIVSYDVGIALQTDDLRVRVGMTAEATIVIEEQPDVLVVPNLYVRRERSTDRTFVNVLREDNTLEEVEVTLGMQGRDTSEVIDGLEEGDLVAIDLGGGGVNVFEGPQ